MIYTNDGVKMFKESFKYYKSKNPLPSFEDVVDFSDIQKISNKVTKCKINPREISFFGLTSPTTWEVYELIDNPGLIFIKNPFTPLGQRYWTVKCLRDYTRKPNKSNLDALKLVPVDSEWWDMCQNNNNQLLKKMRWITLGYHHDWDTKVYSEDNRNDFPEDLGDLTTFIANALGFSNFKSEAAIVNYYHLDSTLSGHTDHSEINLEAPLFSFSLGQTAIFLIGGKTREEKPSAIFLKSGDVVVMSKESRLCYHGVPKILKTESKPWQLIDYVDKNVPDDYKDVVNICRDEKMWMPFEEYLSQSRININIRQVLKRGQKRLYNDL